MSNKRYFQKKEKSSDDFDSFSKEEANLEKKIFLKQEKTERMVMLTKNRVTLVDGPHSSKTLKTIHPNTALFILSKSMDELWSYVQGRDDKSVVGWIENRFLKGL